MRIIHTDEIDDTFQQGATIDLWIYNGLDCCITYEIDDVLNEQIDDVAATTYARSKALMGPILEMNMRGVAIDHKRRVELIEELEADLNKLQANFELISTEGLGYSFSWSSPPQCQKFFYEYVGLPVKKKRDPKTGTFRASVSRDILEGFRDVYPHVRSVISHILALRDIQKQISNLRTLGEGDGRALTNFNIAGTNTRRLSSAWSDFGTGGNLQNVDRRLRTLYVADPGYKFANIDLEQADARNVGAICWALFRKDTFLNAAEGGDLHTTVSRMTWEELAWPDDPSGWRDVADQLFYREDSYRQTAKKLGHGTNFNGQPPTMAVHTKTPQRIIEDFQRRYFARFPEVKERINWVAKKLIEDGHITTLFGARRHFFRRRDNSKTLNEAAAFEPQSMTAEEINGALINIFWLNRVELLLQVHDSILMQYPEDQEEELIPLLQQAMRVPLYIHGREFVVPCEIKVGWNWGDQGFDKEKKEIINPLGLIKWKGSDSRRREDG